MLPFFTFLGCFLIFHLSQGFNFFWVYPFSGIFVLLFRLLRIWESFFYSEVFTYTSSPHLPQYRECYGYERAFFTSRRFLAYAHYRHLALGAGSSCLKVATDTPPIYLSESQSVQQKVLVGSFYFCVKALRNTISTSSRLWTHHLIAICIVKRMLYPLGYRSS